MPRQRLESLRQLAHNEELAAGRKLADSLADLRAREAELDKLRQYMGEYRATLERSGPMDAVRWQSSRLFVNRLHEAIAQREAEFAQLVERRDADLDQWRQHRGRTKAFAQLIEMHDQELSRLRARREQQELDELAARPRG